MARASIAPRSVWAGNRMTSFVLQLVISSVIAPAWAKLSPLARQVASAKGLPPFRASNGRAQVSKAITVHPWKGWRLWRFARSRPIAWAYSLVSIIVHWFRMAPADQHPHQRAIALTRF